MASTKEKAFCVIQFAKTNYLKCTLRISKMLLEGSNMMKVDLCMVQSVWKQRLHLQGKELSPIVRDMLVKFGEEIRVSEWHMPCDSWGSHWPAVDLETWRDSLSVCFYHEYYMDSLISIFLKFVLHFELPCSFRVKKKNSVALVRKRTIPTERPPLSAK
jgi:hypothetical protein